MAEKENAVAVRDVGGEDDIRTMVSAVRNRLAAVRELMKSELKGPTKEHPEGRDYGVVPGTKKNVLLLPGAEKIALMFQFFPSFEITHEDLPGGHREYHALCTLTHGPSGRVVGQCAGSASTLESKHRYRGASGKSCPKCNAMSCKASKKEYGGGYYCDAKAGGCGERFKPGTAECMILDELPTIKQENPDPADQYNTVNKISQKRAYVGAVKGASAASEVFTVDLEDDPGSGGAEPRPPVAMPKETPPSQSTGAKISEAQARRLFAIASKASVSQEDLRLHLRGLGIEHTTDIPLGLYGQVVEWVEAGGQAEPEPGDVRE